MSLASRIVAKDRKPTATVRIGGRLWRGVLSLSRKQSFGQGVSGGTVVGRNPPVEIVEGETTISWTWGYDGYEVAGFTGIVAKANITAYPNRWTLQVYDPLYQARIQRKDHVASPINNVAASEAIKQFLSGAGVTRLNIPALPASGSAWSGSEWRLGQLTGVRFDNTTALDAAQAICSVLGYWLYCDAAGVVRAVAMERRPSSAPFRTLQRGVDILSAGPPDRERDADAVRNRVVVTGANTGVAGAQIRDVWQTGDADRTHEFSSPLIEYLNESEAGAASATAVAKRILRVWSRRPNVVKIGRLKADPRLAVGMTVAIQDSLIGYASAANFFLVDLTTTLDLRKGDFAQSLILDGGTGDQGYTTIPAPLASFAWRLVKETLNGTGVTEVFLDGSGSQSLASGEIISWSWSTATATALSTPSVATGQKAMFIFPAAATTASVTLTVTDTTGKQGSITQTIPLAGDGAAQVSTRVLSLALGAAWAVTPDGGQTWRVETTNGNATVVPEVGGGTLLATRGAGSTGIRATEDTLAGPSVNRAALGGQITALSQTAELPERVWAAVGTQLYRSTDTGATFSLWGTLPATITAVLEDPAALNSVFVLAGADMYQATTETPGTAWSVLYAGPAGATAGQLVRGESGATTWICYTGSFIGSPLQRVEGPITALFPSVSPEVTGIASIALSPDEATVYAWDQAGRGWSVSSATGVATALTGAALASGETAKPALHDPDDPIIYLPTFGTSAGTTYKYFPLQDKLLAFYVPAAGQQAHRIGIGTTSVPPVELLLLTSDTGGGMWHLTRGGWVLKNVGLPVGWTWAQIATNPTNPDDWLIVGSKTSAGVTVSGGNIVSDGQPVLYRTLDSGATWSGVTVPVPAGSSGTPVLPGTVRDFRYIGYTTQGAIFCLVAAGSGDIGVARGTTATLTTTTIVAGGMGTGGHGLTAGLDGDVVAAYRVGGGDRFGFLPAGAGLTATGYQASAPSVLTRPTIADPRLALVVGGNALGVADYRAGNSPSPTGYTVTGGGNTATATADGSVYLGGRTGIARITGLWGTPADSVVAAASATVNAIATDEQTRVAVAAVAGSAVGGTIQTNSLAVHYTLDGATWAVIGGPPAGSADDAIVADAIAIITRPGT